jgi:hypothetical protein
MPALNRKALEKACRRVADNTMWNTPNPKGMSDIITSEEVEDVVARYFKCASETANCVREVGGDPNLVVRAVDYLAGLAIPPIKDDMRWFRESLSTIAELAHPEVTGGEAAYHPIHDDILFAIARGRRKPA